MIGILPLLPAAAFSTAAAMHLFATPRGRTLPAESGLGPAAQKLTIIILFATGMLLAAPQFRVAGVLVASLMKPDQPLRKPPVEPLATFPATGLAGSSAGAAARSGTYAKIVKPAPAMAQAGVFADLTPSVYAALVLSWVCFMTIFFVTFAGS